ncbi:hypothetical protein [Paenibacillus dendrobii]|nr:hypothetical protein [Paenibacillus dendrobii]
MLTVFRILYGKNVKIGTDFAVKGRSLSFFTLNIPYIYSYRRFASTANK